MVTGKPTMERKKGFTINFKVCSPRPTFPELLISSVALVGSPKQIFYVTAESLSRSVDSSIFEEASCLTSNLAAVTFVCILRSELDVCITMGRCHGLSHSPSVESRWIHIEPLRSRNPYLKGGLSHVPQDTTRYTCCRWPQVQIYHGHHFLLYISSSRVANAHSISEAKSQEFGSSMPIDICSN